MVGLALCLPRVGQPQGLPVPREIPKTQKFVQFVASFSALTDGHGLRKIGVNL
jgi:hypothetical protein